jgi:hypothetical protein
MKKKTILTLALVGVVLIAASVSYLVGGAPAGTPAYSIDLERYTYDRNGQRQHTASHTIDVHPNGVRVDQGTARRGLLNRMVRQIIRPSGEITTEFPGVGRKITMRSPNAQALEHRRGIGRVATDCSGRWPVVGQTQLHGYKVDIVEFNYSFGKLLLYQAPALGCENLMTRRFEGDRLVNEDIVTAVRRNPEGPPHATPGLRESKPSEVANEERQRLGVPCPEGDCANSEKRLDKAYEKYKVE